MTPFEMVREFHDAFGMPIGDKPEMLDDSRGNLRWDLIEEEVEETREAYFDFKDLPATAKELADVVYVVYGMAVELGVDLDAVVKEVHFSNMSKRMPDGTVRFREDGKVLKGPNYFEPDIERVLGLKG
jgi:predicted HAD superfamily Cof-like phosphohydrolase